MARIKVVLFAVLALIMIGIAGATFMRLRGMDIPEIPGGGIAVETAEPPDERIVDVNGTQLKMRTDDKLLVSIRRAEATALPQQPSLQQIQQQVQQPSQVILAPQVQPVVTQVVQNSNPIVISVTATPQPVQQVVIVQPTAVPVQVAQPATTNGLAQPATTNIYGRGYGTDAVFFRQYVIQPGDTVFSVASNNGSTVALVRRYGVTEDELIINNVVNVPYPNPNFCNGRVTYVVQRGDTLYTLARSYGTDVQSLRSVNGIGVDNIIRESEVLCLP